MTSRKEPIVAFRNIEFIYIIYFDMNYYANVRIPLVDLLFLHLLWY